MLDFGRNETLGNCNLNFLRHFSYNVLIQFSTLENPPY